MKNLNKLKRVGVALASLAALIGLSPSATAIPLVWLDGPQTGSAFGGGAITIKAFNYDTGTLYGPIPIGTSIGFSGSPGAGVAGGEAALNAAATRPALNAMPATEDSWGIIKITDILAVGSDGLSHSVYNHLVSPTELTAVFWGVRDFHLTQVSPGSGLAGAGQVIDGTGMRVDIYSDPLKDFSQLGGPAARTGVSTYPTASNGTLELSLLSTPGFINANGTFGGTATEFESNTASVGYAALNVIGGNPATVAQFNTNGIGFGGSSGALFTPGLITPRTDVWFAFTATQGDSGWDIRSNDPMLANIAGVPESGSTMLLMLTGLALVLAAHRRRQQNG